MPHAEHDVPTRMAAPNDSSPDKPKGTQIADERPRVRRELLSSPSRVRSVLSSMAANQCSGFVDGSSKRPWRFRIRAYDETAGELVCDFGTSEPISLDANRAPTVLKIEGYASMYWVPITSSRGPASAHRCRIGSSLVRARYRRGHRGPVNDLEVRYNHPGLNTSVQRRVRDISKLGLSFWLDACDPTLTVGTNIESLKIVRRGEVVLSCDAEVRSAVREGAGSACGLLLDVSTLSDFSAWSALVDPVLHPSTEAVASDTDALWELFEASGYMNLSGRSDADFRMLKESFASASMRLARAPQLGCQIVFPAPDLKRIQATISLLKTQNHAWLGYQMAKLPGRVIDGVTRREMLRQVHLHAYEHAGSDPSIRWLLGYVQDGTRFSQMVHQDFAARHVSEGLSAIVRFRAMQTRTDILVKPERSFDVEVGVGDDLDVQRLYRHVAGNFPSAYAKALDLYPERFWLGPLKEAWSAAAFRRERALLVARDGAEVLALAVLELGSEGLHLFGLLDCVRIYPMSPRASNTYDALVSACRQWYRERGREKFVLFREGDDLSLLSNFDDLGYANQTIVSVSLLGDLLEHMFEVTAPSTSG